VRTCTMIEVTSSTCSSGDDEGTCWLLESLDALTTSW